MNDMHGLQLELAVQDAAGANGVVFGALLPSGTIDRLAMTRVRDELWASSPNASFNCHRAMDVAIGADLADSALEDLIDLRVTRVLTSAGASRSIDGAPELAAVALVA